VTFGIKQDNGYRKSYLD